MYQKPDGLVQRLYINPQQDRYGEKNDQTTIQNSMLTTLHDQRFLKPLVPRIALKRQETFDKFRQTIHIGSYQLNPRPPPPETIHQQAYLSRLNDSTISQKFLKTNLNMTSSLPNLQSNIAQANVTALNQKDKDMNLQTKKRMYVEKKNFKRKKKQGNKTKQDDKEEEEEEDDDENALTPNDFITLLRNDPDMADEFCYLNKRNDPYDWKIIKFHKRNPKEYMTISARGITHFIDEEATFLTIEEWEREVHMFTKLKQIKFFKEYKRWKTFTLWKHLRRRNMMKDTAQYLNQHLFMCDPNLRDPLLKIRKLCIEEISQWELVETSYTEPKLPHEFTNSQETFRSNQLARLETTEAFIRSTISKSCKQSLEAFKKENRIQNKGDLEDNEDPPPLLVGDETNKEMPYTQEATIRTHYKRLRKYIKLIDYLLLEAKTNMILFTLERLNSNVINFNDAYKEYIMTSYASKRLSRMIPLLIIEAEFDDIELNYIPTEEQTKQLFNDTIYKSIRLICKRHKQYIHDQEFQIYIKSNDYTEDINEGLIEMDILIESNKKFKHEVDVMNRELDTAFNYLIEASNNINPLLKIYHDNINLDIKSYEGKDVEDVKNAIEMFKYQDEILHSLEPRLDVGLFILEKTLLKNKIVNCAHICLQNLFKLLPELNYIRSIKLLEIVSKLNSKLMNPPASVDDFVIFQESLTETINKKEDIDSKYNEIFYTNQLMEANRIKITDQQRNKSNEGMNQVKTLEKRIKAGEEAISNNINKFKRELEKYVKNMEPAIDLVSSKLEDRILGDKTADVSQVVEFLDGISNEITVLSKNADKFNKYQGALQLEVRNFENLDVLKKNFMLFNRLWKGYKEWEDSLKVWKNTQFMEVDIEAMNATVEKLTKVAFLCVKELEANEVAKIFKDKVESFKDMVDIITSLREPSLEETHWSQIENIIVRENIPEELWKNRKSSKLTFQTIIDLDLREYKEKLADIAVKAVKEKELEKMLLNVEGFWRQSTLVVNPYKEVKDGFILGNNENLISRLDDALVTITNILSSRYVEGIRTRVEKEQKQLSYLQELMDEWITCQKNWIYLETIFSSPDIVKDLPQDSKKFSQEDKQWKIKMKQVNEHPAAKKWSSSEHNLLHHFKTMNKNLDEIQKKLNDFLEKKRLAFPRFFFLSNDDLLDILSKGKEPASIQHHLRKCFENVTKLKFGETGDIIKEMISAEGESVPLKNFSTNKNVEEWLRTLEEHMKDALKTLLQRSYYGYDPLSRKKWISDYPSQIILAVDSIQWTKTSEEYLNTDNPADEMNEWYDVNVQQLEELTYMIRGSLDDNTRRTIVALVTQDVHYRDIIEQMKNERVDNINDFKWQQQLRFYHEEIGCVAKQVNSRLLYGYEYLGATSRLVITPLTDRCWMTITGALHIKLGANPQGPAGTGKTESTKDLAKALGKLCIVFNCSDQVTVLMMEKLFRGLCYTGSWTCLDEFNRIEVEVLSVIAQQVLQIRNALLENLTDFQFSGLGTKLIHTMGIFITMNPGYAGRTELPDNLKVLFRPVSMMVPDYALIAEIMLLAEGFSEAKDLSRKMTKLYKLSSEQLSQQDHYDFGMRAVKSVLVMAGSLKRAEPKLSEDVVLIRAMKDSNIPKFLSHDIPLFNAIISDLFPEAVVPKSENVALEQEIKGKIKEFNLQLAPNFIEKVMQFYETLKVRFGVMLVGPTMSGKSTAVQILKESLTSLKNFSQISNPEFQVVYLNVLNPKCISMNELYGEFNYTTQEWTNGLASKIMIEHASSDTPDKKWVMFDGPVDALWIENMNTVLDDNMTLCLSNGQRIKLKPQMKMLFEVQDLAVASPATVSRCGMVYLDHDVIGIEAITKNYVDNILSEHTKPEYVDHFLKSFNLYLKKTIVHIRKTFVEPIPTVDYNIVNSVVKLLKIFMTNKEIKFNTINDENLKKALDRIFLFCFVWGISSALDSKYLEKFETFLGTIFPTNELPRGSIYDSYLAYNIKPEGEFQKWSDLVPDFVFDKKKKYFELIVPTKDTVRYAWFLSNAIENLNSIFFTGVTGIGKTIVIQNTLEDLKNKGMIIPLNLTFSAKTSSMQTQFTIESKLFVQRKKGDFFLIPPPGKKLVIFVDDINMPAVEEYGAQPPIELLRQFQDKKGFYERKQWIWREIEGSVLIAASAPPGGGRSALTPRFTRHFHMICMPPASEETLKLIFQSILNGFFSVNNFKSDIQAMADQVVHATIDFYDKISKGLLPTPLKAHYTFNLRDVSKIFQGILMTKNNSVGEKEIMIRLWIHETSRVFADRLVNDQDYNWFKENIGKLLLLYFKVEWTIEDVFDNNTIVFADFMKKHIEPEDRVYQEVPNMTALTKIIGDYMDEDTNMKLVLFKDAVVHLAKIARVLRQERGHCMLIGLGGSGKSTLTKLGSVLARCECMTIEPKKDYKKAIFREDLGKMMWKAGVEKKPITFLFPDTHILEEGFLEDVNNLLNSGEVPNMFPKEELEKINTAMQQDAKDANKDTYLYFVERVRANMHIVLAMSPVGDLLRNRMRMFPSLVNCCTINWIKPWPEDALLSVSKMLIEDIKHDGVTQELKEVLSKMCVFAHMTIEEESERFYKMLKRRVYTTPKSYIDLIHSYLKLLEDKNGEISGQRNKLATGLHKLAETNQIVKTLQQNLVLLEPELLKKSAEIEILIEKLGVDKTEANKVREVVETEEKVINEKATIIRELKEEADQKLAEALPIMSAAKDALNSLGRGEIAEVKQNQNPMVKLAWECVAILLGFEKVDADSVKKMLADASLLPKMTSLDSTSLTESVQRKVKAKMKSEPKFTVDAFTTISIAAKSVVKWIYAVVEYGDVAKEVSKKMADQVEKNAQLEEAMKVLKAKQDQLAAVQKKVTDLENQLTSSLKEKERLENEKRLTSERLIRAEELTTGLKDEQERWKEKVEILSEDLKKLIGDVFISSASVCYYGPFTGVFRTNIVDKWIQKAKELELPLSENYTLEKTLGDPVKIREWGICGLPSDSVSINNGILVFRTLSWPLFIDPQLQANKWIKKLEKERELQVIKGSDISISKKTETCLSMGRPLLIEDIEEKLDPSLEPLLSRNFRIVNGRKMVKLDVTEVEYNDKQFSMYFSTKLANPHYLPEVFIRVSVINFTVTEEGLEEQLLADVVRREMPEVEIKKNELITEIARYKDRLKKNEDLILDLLSKSQGLIVDNIELIKNLKESKQGSAIVKQKLAESEITQKEIDEARGKYQPVAERGSILYFVIADLALIDPMYQFSLAYFSRLFNIIIDTSEKSNILEERLSILSKSITESIYLNVCRGLFNTHKQLFSFLVSSMIYRKAKKITPNEWNIFLKGIIFTKPTDFPPLPKGAQFTEADWLILNGAGEQINQIEGAVIAMIDNIQPWQTWLNSDEPFLATLPGNFEEELTPFQKLLIIKILKTDKTLLSMNLFVNKTLGRVFFSTPPATMEEIFQDTDFKTPLIFILSPGADPLQTILRFAKEKKMIEKFQPISLGQGQGEKAEVAIKHAQKMGEAGWVLLQNCHLMEKAWMPKLEALVEKLSDPEIQNTIDPNFRLFLSSMPFASFPVSILQNSVKMTNEPPKGIKSNIMRTYNELINQEKLDSCTKSSVWKKFLFSFSFFHAVIQERRKYGPLGWNICYEFNESDLETSITMLKNMLELHNDILWDAIKFMTGDINYGGRVTDDWDRRCLLAILNIYCNEEILEDTYVFSKSGIYKIPPEGDLASYKKYINEMPDLENPEVFGMHPNASITFEMKESKLALDTILSIQPRDVAGSGGKTSDEIVDELCDVLGEKLPGIIRKTEDEKENVNKKIVKQPHFIDSLHICLGQEIERFNKLLNVIRKSLTELKKAIKGEVVMSMELDRAYQALLKNQVPDMWKKSSYPSLKNLASWYDDLIERCGFFDKWLNKGKPKAFWLPAFFFPQGFLTSILQNYARKNKIPIDILGFSFEFQSIYNPEEIKTLAEDGCYIHGLFIEGCKFDTKRMRLDDSDPGIMFTQAPIILFVPTENYIPDPSDYSMPVYKTTERAGTLSTTGHSTNFIIAIECPTTIYRPEYWIYNGAAFTCAMNN